jgi:sugar phosphate isomerase/epimerase
MSDTTRLDRSRRARREFLAGLVGAGVATAFPAPARAQAAAPPRRRMTIDLICGNLGVKATQREAIDLARRHGFESVFPDAAELSRLPDAEIDAVRAELKEKGLVFGAAFLAVDFRKDDATFERGLADLTAHARALRRAGASRTGTWLPPTSDTLTYLQHFRQTARRLREVARVLADHDLRLGLEYVGPRTSWTARRYPFLHTLAETRELIAEIGARNVGLVLDSWHWYHAGDSAADIRSLANGDVVAVDLNDAPADVPKDQQRDNARELPMATGVIDAGAFLKALVDIGYDGPVRAEPFNEAVRQMPREEAVAATARAMKKAFALLEA